MMKKAAALESSMFQQQNFLGAILCILSHAYHCSFKLLLYKKNVDSTYSHFTLVFLTHSK